MKKDFVHLLYVPFTGLGLKNGYRGDNWFKYRIEIFKNYTLKSLLNQTNRQFIIWLSFRPQEKDNPLTKEFARYMLKVDQPSVFTFGGLCFWDDKYPDEVEERRLWGHLSESLPDLKEIVGNRKYVYETLQPSDDIYHKDEIKTIQEQEFGERKAIIHNKGYLLNEQTKTLADWEPVTNPPFYTIMYPADVFLDPQKHFEYMKGFRSHEDIPKLFNCVRLADHRYCVIIHEKNISTTWYHPFRVKTYSLEEGKRILKDFGIINFNFIAVAKFGERARYWFKRFLIKTGTYKYARSAKQLLTNLKIK